MRNYCKINHNFCYIFFLLSTILHIFERYIKNQKDNYIYFCFQNSIPQYVFECLSLSTFKLNYDSLGVRKYCDCSAYMEKKFSLLLFLFFQRRILQDSLSYICICGNKNIYVQFVHVVYSLVIVQLVIAYIYLFIYANE